jgi:zinc protease
MRPFILRVVRTAPLHGRLARAVWLLSIAAWTAATAAPPSPAGGRVGGWAAPPAWLERVPEEGAAHLYRFDCPNGLPVVVEGRPGSRTVYIQIGVRVGSRDEPEGLAGMSHLLEHLLFKEGHGEGARRNPAFSALRAAGGLINASTDFELTEYHADLPADRFEEGWDALVSLVTDTAFDDEDVRRERNVVLQEVALGKTDPMAIAAYSVLRRVFPGDPIAQPVIGFRRTLKKIRKQDLDSYYARYYVPANMYAVVVGDVDPVVAAERVRRSLGSLPGQGRAHPPYPVPAARLKPLYRFRTLVKQSYLLAGALTAGDSAPDAPALEMLARILGGGRTSRLHRRFVEKEALTGEILALSFSVSNVGAFGTGLAVDRKRTDEAREALLEELGRLAREPVPAEELETSLRLLRGGVALMFEMNAGVAAFRSRRLQMGQPVSRDAYLARYETLTPEILLEAARTHWGRPAGADRPDAGLVEIQILPARGFGKVIAALKFLIFRRL